jgi:hypothetical protein
MSRYLERAENTVRQLDVTMGLMLDTGGASAETAGSGWWPRWASRPAWSGTAISRRWPASWSSTISTRLGHVLRQRRARKRPPGARRNLQRAVAAPQPPLSPDALAAGAGPVPSSINDALSSVVDGIHLFKGVSDTTMIHGQGWQFIRLGRYLERAYATATLLEVYQPISSSAGARISGYQYLELVGLLRCCTSFEAYCQVYTADFLPIAFSSFCCSTATFPTPSATAWTASARPSNPFSAPAAAASPTS